jgi:hypothetical protein
MEITNGRNRRPTPGQVRYLHSLRRRQRDELRAASQELFGRDVTLEMSGDGPGDMAPAYVYTLNAQQASDLIDATTA